MRTKQQLLLLQILFVFSLVACDSEIMQNAVVIEDYQSARKIFWRGLYAHEAESLYCGEPVSGDARRGYNIEHVFPMSWVTKGLECGTRKQCRARSADFNRIEADLNNLYPSLESINSARSSFRFGEISGEQRRYSKHCDLEIDYHRRVVEPRVSVRGDIARTMFYMAWRYRAQGLRIFKRSGQTLQEWHNIDPPSVSEIARNQRVARLQGIGNRFVDEPQKLNQLIDAGFFY